MSMSHPLIHVKFLRLVPFETTVSRSFIISNCFLRNMELAMLNSSFPFGKAGKGTAL